MEELRSKILDTIRTSNSTAVQEAFIGDLDEATTDEIIRLFSQYILKNKKTFKVEIRDANGYSSHHALTLDSVTVLRGPESEVTIRLETPLHSTNNSLEEKKKYE